ncbi:MAG: hypothetical protein HYZ53_19030 [Planctomycetes bacterium]|nr:hypothetical protein [Planctomycetota bacterium]
MKPGDPRRGFALVFCVGMLALLSVLGVYFTTMTSVEAGTAKAYLEQARARLLAQSGVERACAELQRLAWTQAWEDLRAPWSYKRFTDANGNGAYDRGEAVVSVPWRGGPESDTADLDGSQYPSLREGVVDVGAVPQGYSGRVGATYADGMDAYALRIMDCAGRIYINGPVEVQAGLPTRFLASNVRRMLDTLGRQLGIAGLGNTLSNNRPALGYQVKSELRPLLGTANYDKVQDFLTTHAWVDFKTLNPAALQPITGAGTIMQNPNRRWSMTRFQPSFASCSASDHQNDSLRNFDFQETTEPGRWVVSGQPQQPILQPRAPINVNTASREVLVAVFNDLGADCLDRSGRTGVRPGTTVPGGAPNTVIDLAAARRLADAVLAYRVVRSFTTWEQFNAFINSQALAAPLKQLVKAAANPNSRLHGMNYNKALGWDSDVGSGARFGDTDKAALKRWTTEFCFSSMGYFEVESLGLLVRSGVAVAKARLTVLARVYQVLRHSTQYDFESCASGRSGVASFPEPVSNFPGSGNFLFGRGRTGDVDGNVQLAPFVAPAGNRLTFRADFVNGLLADRAKGNPTASGTADDGVSVFDYRDPSELRPDGVFCHESDRVSYNPSPLYGSARWRSWDEYLRYDSNANLPANGTLELWVKPTWDSAEVPSDITDTKTFFSCGAQTLGWGYPSNFSVRRRFCLYYRAGRVNFYVGNNVDGTSAVNRPVNYPDRFQAVAGPYAFSTFFGKASVPVSWRAGEWHQLVAVWQDSKARLYVDGVKCGNDLTPIDGWTGGKPGWSMHVGHNRFLRNMCNGYPFNADCTIGSVRIHDSATLYPAAGFPPPDRFDRNLTGQLRLRLFPTLTTGAGLPGRLGTLSWTRYVPINGRTGNYVNTAVALDVMDGTNLVATATGDGSGVPLGAASDDLSQVNYVISLTPPNVTPCVETPILDDVTLTYAAGTTYCSCFWSAE